MSRNDRGDFKGFFRILSNFFQILGAVVGIFALFVAVRALANESTREIIMAVVTGNELPIQEPKIITSEPIVITATSPPSTPTAFNNPTSTNTPLPSSTPTSTAPPTLTPTTTNTSSPTHTPIPTFTPTPVPPPDFYDSFDTGLHLEWKATPDEWASVNGKLVNLKGGVRLRVGHESWTNYSVEVDMIQYQYLAWEDSFCDVIILITQDNKLKLRMHNNSVVWRYGGNNVPNSRIKGLSLPYTVRVTTQGSLITTFINDEQKHQMNLSSFDHGRVGLYCNVRGATLDNFRVSPLP